MHTPVLGTASYWQRRAWPEPRHVDVAVVGGGIVGCSTAYWLRRHAPGLRVAIVEAERIAHGASGRNAGFLLQGAGIDYASDVDALGADAARRYLQFTIDNRRWIEEELGGEACMLEPAGSLTVAGDRAEAARLERSAALLRDEGVRAVYLDADAANARLGSRAFPGALWMGTGATVDSVRLVRNVAARSGAQLLEHHRVLRAADDAGGAVLETTGGVIRADRLVLALNAYAPLLLPALGRWVRPVRAQMLATAPGLPRTLDAPTYSHEGYFYLRQLDDGRVLLGGARHEHVADEVGWDDATTDALQASLDAYRRKHFPAFADVPVAMRWSGTMGFSPDGRPVVGDLPGLPGLFACGFSGHGMGHGFAMGRLLARMLSDAHLPADAELFSSRRPTLQSAQPA